MGTLLILPRGDAGSFWMSPVRVASGRAHRQSRLIRRVGLDQSKWRISVEPVAALGFAELDLFFFFTFSTNRLRHDLDRDIIREEKGLAGFVRDHDVDGAPWDFAIER